MIWLRKLFGGLKAEASFILLLAVVCVGAWQYVQARHAERDRDDAVRRAELVCSAVGVDWTEKHMRGPGTACAQRARQLRTDREAIDRETARLLSDAIEKQAARSSTRPAIVARSSSRWPATTLPVPPSRSSAAIMCWRRPAPAMARSHCATAIPPVT